MSMPKKIVTTSLIAFLAVAACPAHGYSEDVHFHLTLLLCRMAGMTRAQAGIIANANQSMDQDDGTTAFDGIAKVLTVPWQHNGKLWHAFSNGDAAHARRMIEMRMEELRLAAFKPARPLLWDDFVIKRTKEGVFGIGNSDPSEESITIGEIRRLIRFGQFLHFQQDYYSHRRMGFEYMRDDQFVPYSPAKGHGVEHGIQPDCIPNRVLLAKKMAKASFKYISDYAKHVLKIKSLFADRIDPHSDYMIDELIDALAISYKGSPQHYKFPNNANEVLTTKLDSMRLPKMGHLHWPYGLRGGSTENSPTVYRSNWPKVEFDKNGVWEAKPIKMSPRGVPVIVIGNSFLASVKLALW